MSDNLLRALPGRRIARLASLLAEHRELWAPWAARHPSARASTRLVATDEWEAWVLGWPPGEGVEYHGHGGSAGAFVVVEGTLVELLALVGKPACLVRREVPTGRAIPVASHAVHDVVNAGTGHATSIHVYSPPLRSMTFYDPVGFEPLRNDPVAPESPRWPLEVLVSDPAWSRNGR